LAITKELGLIGKFAFKYLHLDNFVQCHDGFTKDLTGCSRFIHEDTTSEVFSPYPPPKRSEMRTPKYKIAFNGSFKCETETDVTASTSTF
jgi:hypothetical protein